MDQFDTGQVMPGQDMTAIPFEMSPEDIAREERMADLRRRIITLQRITQLDNAAEVLDDAKRSEIGSRVIREYKIDVDSRSDWEDRARRAMDLAKQKKEAKSFPWPDSSNVKYPLLTTAALQFAARAYPAIVDGERVVKCKVNGYDPQGQKSASAERVSQHMSFQLLHQLPSWEDDMDTALHQIPIVGCAFRKVYPDKSSKAGFRSELISAFDLIVNQRAKSLETVPRVTHKFPLYPHEIGERIRSGWFLDVDLNKADDAGDDDDAPHVFLEQHRWIDLDGDGTPEPWIATVHETTQKLVRLKPCFDINALDIDNERGVIVKIPRHEYFVLIPFIPDPEGGFYPVGFGHLLEPISDVIDTTINQMMDAGTLQNAGGGFIGSGVQLGKGKSEIRLRPGEYKTVSTPGQDLRQGIYNMQHPGPSPVLFELLGMMVDSGKEIAAIKDVLSGDSPKNQTATATMALIEQGLKVFTAIYKRIYRALGKEFKLIFNINRAAFNAQVYSGFHDAPPEQIGMDYMGEMDVLPVSDPAAITDMQRMAKAQLVLEEAKNGNPHVNIFEATKRAFEAARVEDVEGVLIPPPPPDAPKPPSAEEQAMQMKAQESSAALELKAQDAQITLGAKQAAAEIDIKSKADKAVLDHREALLKHAANVSAIELREQEINQKWRALEIKEAEMNARSMQAANRSAN